MMHLTLHIVTSNILHAACPLISLKSRINAYRQDVVTGPGYHVAYHMLPCHVMSPRWLGDAWRLAPTKHLLIGLQHS